MRYFRSQSLYVDTYRLNRVNVILALHELPDDGPIVERGRQPSHEVPLFLKAGVRRHVREWRFGIGKGRGVFRWRAE
jgi:hypothetical protein